MTEVIRIEKENAVFFKVYSSDGVAAELWERFSFKVPGYKFNPAYKKGKWSGDIRLFKLNERRLYQGLFQSLCQFCTERDYELDLSGIGIPGWRPIHDGEKAGFVRDLDIPPQYEVRDYQWEALNKALTSRRALFVSPTSSGKSLIIYMLCRYLGGKILIVVPRIGLVHQLTGDFRDYGLRDIDQWVHKLQGGERGESDKPITISTWQSAIRQTTEWFQGFDTVIGDEAHLFTAASLTSIMEALTNASNRIGFTGTLSGSMTHQMCLEGLFGPVEKVTTTSALIEQGYVAKPNIKIIKLKHPIPPGKRIKRTYPQEYEAIITCEARNNFITELVSSLKGNSLILCRQKEKQGHVLEKKIRSRLGERLYYVHGGIDGLEREEIRGILERSENSILLATYGTTSTGVNIRRIHNLIFASPNKGRIINLQSLGRGLRIGEDKTELDVYDLADDMTWVSKKGNPYPNFGMFHMAERIKIYAEEQLDFKVYPVTLRY